MEEKKEDEEEKSNEMELEIVSGENGMKQQQIINKIPIDDEAHAYMWSILTLMSKNFLSLFSQINTFRLNWFNGRLLSNVSQQKSSAEEKAECKERNPKRSAKAQNEFSCF